MDILMDVVYLVLFLVLGGWLIKFSRQVAQLDERLKRLEGQRGA